MVEPEIKQILMMWVCLVIMFTGTLVILSYL